MLNQINAARTELLKALACAALADAAAKAACRRTVETRMAHEAAREAAAAYMSALGLMLRPEQAATWQAEMLAATPPCSINTLPGMVTRTAMAHALQHIYNALPADASLLADDVPAIDALNQAGQQTLAEYLRFNPLSFTVDNVGAMLWQLLCRLRQRDPLIAVTTAIGDMLHNLQGLYDNSKDVAQLTGACLARVQAAPTVYQVQPLHAALLHCGLPSRCKLTVRTVIPRDLQFYTASDPAIGAEVGNDSIRIWPGAPKQALLARLRVSEDTGRTWGARLLETHLLKGKV